MDDDTGKEFEQKEDLGAEIHLKSQVYDIRF